MLQFKLLGNVHFVATQHFSLLPVKFSVLLPVRTAAAEYSATSKQDDNYIVYSQVKEDHHQGTSNSQHAFYGLSNTQSFLADLHCWFLLSPAFLSGKHTGQSCLVQFFQCEMICREDAQCATEKGKGMRSL